METILVIHELYNDDLITTKKYNELLELLKWGLLDTSDILTKDKKNVIELSIIDDDASYIITSKASYIDGYLEDEEEFNEKFHN